MLKTSCRKLIVGGDGRLQRSQKVRATASQLAMRRKAVRRQIIDMRQERHAIEHILKLPEKGESLHFVIDGKFEPCDIIPATRRLSDPATIKMLVITTLSFNVDNIATLMRGMDQGKIGGLLLVTSHYFQQVERSLFEQTRLELEKRGGHIAADRVHAKLILMEMTNGDCFTVEGSGNLRSCNSIEQFVMTNDKCLLEFHRNWIEENAESQAGRKKATSKKGSSEKATTAKGG